jgi:flavin-binding protein dodecin
VYEIRQMSGRGASWRQAARFAVADSCGRLDDARVGQVRSLRCELDDDRSVRFVTEMAVSVKFRPDRGRTPGDTSSDSPPYRPPSRTSKEKRMPDSVYQVIELIGSSSDSWELAAQNAVREASRNYEDLRVAEVVEMDVLVENGAIIAYRTKLRLSFKQTARQ